MVKKHSNYVKMCFQEKRVKVIWVSTIENTADIMTEHLPVEPHEYFRDIIMNNYNNAMF